MNKLIIMRGLPSSGKSTKAKEILEEGGVIFSTDDYWFTEVGDDPTQYDFRFDQLGKAHVWNQDRARLAMQTKVSQVIIDNTNITKKDFAAYLAAAEEYGYSVQYVEPNSPHWIALRKLMDRDWETFVCMASRARS